jgi:hypothetical protein
MDWVFLCEAHDVESNLSRLGETRAGEEGRDDLVMTTAGAKEIAAWSLRVGLHPNPRVLAELGRDLLLENGAVRVAPDAGPQQG